MVFFHSDQISLKMLNVQVFSQNVKKKHEDCFSFSFQTFSMLISVNVTNFVSRKTNFETNWSFQTELSKFDEIISKKGNLKQTVCSGRSISLNHNT